jgi:response regulator RpfG family c-di-GMP phosphodiesterase
VDVVGAVVIALVAVATLGLLYYVRIYLPGRLDGRFRQSLNAFSTAVELRFPSHKGLTERVVPISREVGKRLGLNAKKLNDLETAAILRDIGLCAIPYKLVNGRAVVSWSQAEWDTYDRHPEVSAAMLELVPSLREIAPIVRCHHARFDGSSGPFFPSRDALPLEARILKVVTEYVWAERNQGAVLASDELVTGSGTSYDPAVVEALRAVLTSSRGVRSESLVGV